MFTCRKVFGLYFVGKLISLIFDAYIYNDMYDLSNLIMTIFTLFTLIFNELFILKLVALDDYIPTTGTSVSF